MTTQADIRIARSMTNIAINHIIAGDKVTAVDARLCGAVLVANMINSASGRQYKQALDEINVGLFAYPVTPNRVVIQIGAALPDDEFEPE